MTESLWIADFQYWTFQEAAILGAEKSSSASGNEEGVTTGTKSDDCRAALQPSRIHVPQLCPPNNERLSLNNPYVKGYTNKDIT